MGPRVSSWYLVDAPDSGRIYLPMILRGLGRAARKSLWQSGLLEPAWLQRLARAPRHLIQFIRRFSNIAGFEYAVKGFFGNDLQRRVALMSMRLTRLIARAIPDYDTRLVFTPDVGTASGGATYLTLRLDSDGRHFIFLPWSELEEQSVRQQFVSNQSLFGSQNAIRWVLSARVLGMQKSEVIARIKNLLEGNLADEHGTDLVRLKNLIIVLS